MKKAKCSECGGLVDIKPAGEYPELADFLKSSFFEDVLLCPKCASAVVGDLRGETIAVLPLDLRKPTDQAS